MRYHPDDFLRLVEEVEAQGGAWKSERCVPDSFKLRQPVPGNADKFVMKEFFTAGCGQDARFVVNYDPSTTVKIGNYVSTPHPDDVAAQAVRGAGLAKVCAVDDGMGWWPRFQHIIEEE